MLSPPANPRLPWLDALHERVLALELSTLDLQPALEEIAGALRDAGFGPERLSVAILTHHPGLSGLAYVWRQSEGRVEFFERPWGFLDSEEHRQSPLHHVLTARAALFLDAFVPDTVPWVHFDLYAWTSWSSPGRPEGAAAQTLRAVLATLRRRYAPPPTA